MKKHNKLLVALSFASILVGMVYACGKENMQSKTEENEGQIHINDELPMTNNYNSIIEAMVDSILCRADFWQALDSCSLIMKKCIESPYPDSSLSPESDAFCNRIGISQTRYNDINNFVSTVFNNISDCYPEVLSFAFSNTNCLSCDDSKPSQQAQLIIQHFKNTPELPHDLKEILNYVPPGTGNNNNQSGTMSNNCDDYFNYTLCLLVCTTTGPVVYWICGYLCMCQYCPTLCVQI